MYCNVKAILITKPAMTTRYKYSCKCCVS